MENPLKSDEEVKLPDIKEKPYSRKNLDFNMKDFERVQKEQQKRRDELKSFLSGVKNNFQLKKTFEDSLKKEENEPKSLNKDLQENQTQTFLTEVSNLKEEKVDLQNIPELVLQVGYDKIKQYIEVHKMKDLNPFIDITDENFKKDGMLKIMKLDLILQEKENEYMKILGKQKKKIVKGKKIGKDEKKLKRPSTSEERIKRNKKIEKIKLFKRKSFDCKSKTLTTKETMKEFLPKDECLNFNSIINNGDKVYEDYVGELEVKKLNDINNQLKKLKFNDVVVKENLNNEKRNEKIIQKLIENAKHEQREKNIQVVSKEKITELLSNIKNKTLKCF